MPPAEAETGEQENDRAQQRIGERLQRIFRPGRRRRRDGHRGRRREASRSRSGHTRRGCAHFHDYLGRFRDLGSRCGRCLGPWRSSARRWAISTFITVPFRVLFVTSRLSPYGFNPGCTSTLCGQFTRTERKISDNHWLPHPRTGNLRLFQAASPRPLAPPSQRKSSTSSVTADTRANPRCGNPASERADRAMRPGRD